MSKFISSDKLYFHPKALMDWANGFPVDPVTVEVWLTMQCNNACFYCSMKGVKTAKQMSRKEVEKTIDFVSHIGTKGIIFSGGGEPTIHPNFEHAIHLAKAKGLDIGVITNGVALNASMENTILENAKWVRISLDADNSETYKKIRGTDSFSRVVLNVKSLLIRKFNTKSNCTVGLQIVVNKYNYKRIRLITQFMLKEFPLADYIQIRPVETRINETPYSLNELNEIEPQLNFFKNTKKILISDKWDLCFNNAKCDFGFTACHCAEFIGAIDSYGNFSVCCHTTKNKGYQYCNVFEPLSKSFFFSERKSVLEKLGKTRGFNPKICPICCRGSAPNRVLEGLSHEPDHKNFL